MTKDILQLNEEVIKGGLKEPVRNSVEEMMNGLLERKPSNWPMPPDMNDLRNVRGVAADTITAILPRYSARLPSKY